MRNYYSNVKVSEIFKNITLEDQQKYRDNLAFNLDLQGFMKELRKAFRGVVFTPQGDMRKVYMHMPNDPYVMGYIGLRPLTTRDMALDEYNDMQRKSNDTESRASNAKNTAQSDLLARSNREKKIEYNPMLEYMRTLVKVGHEFTDKELESNLLTYFKLEDEHKVLLDKGINVSYVRIYEKYGKQVFDVAPIISKDRYNHIVGDITPYGKADVPEDIVGKVSMLSMVDNGHWVDDVGYRVDATMFYVTAKSNE